VAKYTKDVRESADKVVAAHEEMPLNTKLGVKCQIPQAIQRKMTQDDCIELLQRVCKARPDIVISRDWFRKNSGIMDSTWSSYFGKFSQYKAKAGIKVERRANRLLLNVAKHSAADDLRKMNKERRSYGSKYLKPKSGRWKTILLSGDTHDKECDPFAQRVYLDVARRLGSGEGCGVLTDIFHLGDLYDLPEFGRYTVDPREWDPVNRIRWVDSKHWKPLRRFCPNETFTLLEGNHEIRISALLAAQTPAVKVVLSDLHGMTIPSFLGLDNYEVNYVANADLAAVDFTKSDVKKELERNYHILYDCFLGHHFPTGQRKGLPGAHGHHHKHRVWSHDSPMFGAYEWHQMGAMHYRYATYADGEKWNNGFALVHIDNKTKAVEFEYITVGSTQCMAAGVFYTRRKNELLGKV
jgi:hypothetical protein